MTKSKVTLAGLLLALLVVPTAQAQVTVDVAKITCEQFVLWKVTDPDKIAIWLSGYHHAKANNTVIDTKSFEESNKKLTEYCRSNFKMTVMQAAEKLFAAKK